jgi:hypothetical protein
VAGSTYAHPSAGLVPFRPRPVPRPALAWGSEGHQVVALIARQYLKREAPRRVDAILATDHDTLTAPDMAARATWADAWRREHKGTENWHFADIELNDGDLAKACPENPPSDAPASAGPTTECIVAKLEQFTREIAAPATSPQELLLALKFLLHFADDLHQPLHASDNNDRGGNCVALALGGPRIVNLHGYWDSLVVGELDPDAKVLAKQLGKRITRQEMAAWSAGTPEDWARESFGIAKQVVYTVQSLPGCDDTRAPITLPAGYDDQARRIASGQLAKAG